GAALRPPGPHPGLVQLRPVGRLFLLVYLVRLRSEPGLRNRIARRGVRRSRHQVLSFSAGLLRRRRKSRRRPRRLRGITLLDYAVGRALSTGGYSSGLIIRMSLVRIQRAHFAQSDRDRSRPPTQENEGR